MDAIFVYYFSHRNVVMECSVAYIATLWTQLDHVHGYIIAHVEYVDLDQMFQPLLCKTLFEKVFL